MWKLTPAAIRFGAMGPLSVLGALGLLGALDPPAAAATPPTETVAAFPTSAIDGKTDDLRAAFLALEDEYEDARDAYYGRLSAAWKAHEAAGGDGSDFEAPKEIEPEFYDRFRELADQGYAPANMWCLYRHRASGLMGETARLDKLERMVGAMTAGLDEKDQGTLAMLIGLEAKPHRRPEDKGTKLGADVAFGLLDLLRTTTDSDEVKARTLYARGDALYDDERLNWFRKAAEAYPGTDSGQRSAGMVFEAESLQIGQVAPDIIGKDHDGNDIRRSDFEGKVTVLDFWGFW